MKNILKIKEQSSIKLNQIAIFGAETHFAINFNKINDGKSIQTFDFNHNTALRE